MGMLHYVICNQCMEEIFEKQCKALELRAIPGIIKKSCSMMWTIQRHRFTM